ncbi:SCO family protein [Fodinibius sediminis]|uniref:Protein SCO1/2 n=1 Tax=Fodinibius sediminis TaxID=1214077 RepID=A0A521C979_9BACT|nr:SCO family protein [Fodinibius sediminis]SMO55361.1 protein SCO1/2 [Fodinibius sediminis]
MRSTLYILLAFGMLAVFLEACSGPDTIADLSNESYQLLDSDSSSIIFPSHFRGETTVISFIYTHCPDVCPIITANMKNIQSGLADTSDVQFVEITFDPERDTPSVLAEYRKVYRLNDQFTLLTGQPAIIDSLMSRLHIVAKKAKIDSLQQDSSDYFMQHSNTIYIMDQNGRVRTEYPASVVPPENVIEDLKKIR